MIQAILLLSWQDTEKLVFTFLPWLLAYAFFRLFLLYRKKAGEAYADAARHAPTEELKFRYGRKSLLAGNRKVRTLCVLSAPDIFSERHPLEIFKIRKIPCVFSGFYFPSRYRELLNRSQARFTRRVLDFKDGKHDGIDFFRQGIGCLQPTDGTVIMFMPCSAWWKYWVRFRKIADYITKECPELVNGFNYYMYKGERETLHLQKNRAAVSVEKNYETVQDLTGKSIIVVDDVITTGKSLKMLAKDIEDKGGRVVGAIFLAGTFAMPGCFLTYLMALTADEPKRKRYKSTSDSNTVRHMRSVSPSDCPSDEICHVDKPASPHKAPSPGCKQGKPKSANKSETDEEEWIPDRIIMHDDSSMDYCYIHWKKGGSKPYYTAIHIPSDEKKAKYILDHLKEIIEADKHREPTEYERSLCDHSYFD